MTSYSPSEKAMPIRQPSTANLMLDSFDRDATTYITPWAFSINRANSILNGFFTRIGTTEVVLEWNIPNILTGFNDSLDISANSTTYTVPFTPGFYTVAEILDNTVDALNILSSSTDWSVKTVGGITGIDLSGGTFQVLPGNLQQQLGLTLSVSGFKPINRPDLRPWRYLDFISSQLTYNQDLKDASTCPIVRDVLCRWYMDWDTPPPLDTYGYPILMGYTAFSARRLFNPPKQIRWDHTQPIGQIAFEVFGQSEFYPTGIPLASIYPTALGNTHTNWLMTLQVSEV